MFRSNSRTDVLFLAIFTDFIVMPGLVPGIHVFFEARKAWVVGHRRAEATPSFGRLCPAMTAGV